MEMTARPIWHGEGRADEYAEFLTELETDGEQLTMLLAADSEYALYLDGKLLSFGQYADYPGRVIYDRITVTPPAGRHTWRVLAWHWGANFFTHIRREAYVIFELFGEDGRTLAASSQTTPSRKAPGYVPYKYHTISPQLGYMCEYSDAHAAEGSLLPYSSSREVNIGEYELHERPIERCELRPQTEMRVIRRGFYRLPSDPTLCNDAGLMLDNAVLTDEREGADGCFIVTDVGYEETGFLKFLLKTNAACRAVIGWGEHLTDGRLTPRAAVHSRRFCYIFESRGGAAEHIEPLRRVGGRYLELFCSDPDAELTYLGLLPTRYPTHPVPPPADPRERRIYDVALRSLECCMHEHYEDCPWREQSLYTFDSRIQMRCGYRYFADGNLRFVRASLDLISRSQRPDGLLSLCAPAGEDRPIPGYSLAYVAQMREYADESGDHAFVLSKMTVLEGIMTAFSARIGADGTLSRFPDRDGYWNFYEWAPTLDGAERSYPPEAHPAEAPLTALFVNAADDMAAICRMGAAEDDTLRERAEYYLDLAHRTAAAMVKCFFDRERGYFRSFSDRPEAPFAATTQALCLLAGQRGGAISAADPKYFAAFSAMFTAPRGMIGATLSSAIFALDAAMAGGEAAAGHMAALREAFDSCLWHMLDCGATTLWETMRGRDDFGGAGSLCHAWSVLLTLPHIGERANINSATQGHHGVAR